MLTLSATFSGLILAILSGMSQCKSDCASKSWDYLSFRQQWPPSFCMENYCPKPASGKLWTVHGLWPTQKSDDRCPAYCDDSMKFNASAIESIADKLDKYWPDLRGSGKSFWKHEWTRHGTCAMSLPALDTEYKYFNMGIQLSMKYNIFGTLQTKGITPENKPYKMAQIEDALAPSGGLKFGCYRKEGKMYLYSIQICLDKQFLHPQSCPDSLEKQQNLRESQCSRDDDVYYPSETPDEYLYQ